MIYYPKSVGVAVRIVSLATFVLFLEFGFVAHTVRLFRDRKQRGHDSLNSPSLEHR